MATLLRRDSFRLQRSFRSAGDAAKAAIATIAGTARPNKATGAGIGGRGGSGGGDALPENSPGLTLGADATHAFWEVLSYSELLGDAGVEASFLDALVDVR